MDREESINADIDNHLRRALNSVWVLLKERCGDPPSKHAARAYLRQRLLFDVGPSPAAWQFQADRFPFEEGSGDSIGAALQQMDPERYQRVGE